jgi:hypothetical protein
MITMEFNHVNNFISMLIVLYIDNMYGIVFSIECHRLKCSISSVSCFVKYQSGI